MSIFYPGRVYQTSTTTGTGTLTLSGSSAAAVTWQAKFGAGPVPVLYLIQGATYFEMGRGVFTAPSSLTRVDIYSSSNSDALVVLPSATHDVFAWLPGEARYTVSFSATKTLAISEWSTIQQFTGSSAATFNLPAKANMPGGFHCTIQNDGTANLTIDPSGAETVEGVATTIMYPGQFGELSYDGTTWRFKTSPNYSNGNLVGINMLPVNVIDVTQTQNASSRIAILNASAGGAANAAFEVLNGTSTAFFYINGTGFSPSGIDRAGGAVVTTSGPGGLTLATTSPQPIYNYINNVLTSRLQNGNGVNCIEYTNAGNATPFGIVMTYSAAAPNGTGNEFLTCTDTGATRFVARSNGGLANFSANNVNLSDISVKPEFQKHTSADLVALEASFVAVDWGRFKYADQTHDDWNYGYSAQGVETAFAITVPAMTDVWNPGAPPAQQLRAVYTEDLNNIAHALLARALTRVAALEARLAAAGL